MSATTAQLRDARFSHPTRDIRVRETHLSYVVLTGDFAYKIKKAIKLDFIDTTSLEQRRTLCEAEVRLNRRYAPDLYLGVVPVSKLDEQLVFDNPDAVVEYAVQMRQFDTDAELQALLSHDRVQADDFATLADRVAKAHREADTYSASFPAGTDAYRRKARENVESVIERAPLIDAADLAAELQQWTATRLDTQLDGLHERERNGFIRECHGDLHTGNILRWRDALAPFDCLEFDPQLRFIDVLSDAAFLVMDLIDRGRADFAFVFLSRYLERTGDYSGITLLPDYLVYRALIRAKVELISLQQHPDEAEPATRARSLLETARGFARSSTPTLIVMHGASGSGKSWLSEQLVPVLPAVRIRSDLERKRIAGLDPFAHGAPPDERIYTLEFNERTYEHLRECARACLRAGLHTIVDAAFLKQRERDAFARLAQREDARVLIVSCTADRVTLEQRIAARRDARNDPSDADERVLHRQLETMEPIAAHERAYTLFVNTQDADAIQMVEQRCRSERSRG